MRFIYDTGVRRRVFHDVRLRGSFTSPDQGARWSDQTWSVIPMREEVGPDGAVIFVAEVALSAADVGKEFRWAVLLSGPYGLDLNGVVTECGKDQRDPCYRAFVLGDDPSAEQRYYLTHVRRLGANKAWLPGKSEPGIRFSVWAPHARNVEVVFGQRERGYIADDGDGIDPNMPVIALRRGDDGVWAAGPREQPVLASFAAFVNAPYMFRITREEGTVAYRTDLYSRAQLGLGETNPRGKRYDGGPQQLDGVVSCSVVVDTDLVSRDFAPPLAEHVARVPEAEFWKDELDHAHPVPHRIEDLVIYELHVGSLGFGKEGPGTFADALALLDHLVELGVNAVELLPVAEFNGTRTWGYGNSHHFAITSSGGGRDQLRHFVRECHRRGIAVLMDVVYNHFVPDGERAQWHYDSDREEHNLYYWYEGKPSDYQSPDGGYLDNLSSGFAPRLGDEMVRKLFISSAVAMVEGFHVDGFRVDLTSALHAYNVLHADGRPVPAANVAGACFLRELSRTLRLTRPSTLLICEDHSDWPMITEPTDPPEVAGLGFDATWFAAFYHHLIGDTGRGPSYANLLWTAGMGGDGPLAMDAFAGVLAATGRKTIVYHESHDEAGNSPRSRRTLAAALALAEGAPPEDGELREIAEARCRFAAGMALLAAGTPMFLMGEEVGAAQDFRFNDFIHHREDLYGARTGHGRRLFAFYRDLIRLRLRHRAFTSLNIDIVATHNDHRLLAFRRWKGTEEYLIVATLSDRGWPEGYPLAGKGLMAGRWLEIFTSDLPRYGGAGVGNGAAPLHTDDGGLKLNVPARGFVVLRRIPEV
jgi:1,4-alpha-glucan branching enzyme